MSLANPNLNTSRAITGEALRRAEAKGLIRKTGNMPASDVSKNVQVTDTEGLSPESIAQRLDEGPAYDASANDDLIYNNPANIEPSHPSVFAKGYSKTKSIHQRRINNQLRSVLGLGTTAYALNQGVGLFGRPEGYTAASPDQLDPRDYTSAVDEVATKYLLGRPGRMDKDLMELERPDVSPGQRVAYQDYLYSKDEGLDLNPFDGDGINIGGVLQTTGDGIHGPEVRFLGRSLGIGEGIMLTVGAIAATAVIGASFIAANPARANTGCYHSLAATVMKQVIRGGGSFELSAQATAEEGYAIATKTCWYRIKSQLDQQMKY